MVANAAIIQYPWDHECGMCENGYHVSIVSDVRIVHDPRIPIGVGFTTATDQPGIHLHGVTIIDKRPARTRRGKRFHVDYHANDGTLPDVTEL